MILKLLREFYTLWPKKGSKTSFPRCYSVNLVFFATKKLSHAKCSWYSRPSPSHTIQPRALEGHSTSSCQAFFQGTAMGTVKLNPYTNGLLYHLPCFLGHCFSPWLALLGISSTHPHITLMHTTLWKEPKTPGSAVVKPWWKAPPQKNLHPTSSQGISPKKIAARWPIEIPPIRPFKSITHLFFAFIFAGMFLLVQKSWQTLSTPCSNEENPKSDCSPCNCFPFTFW